MKKIFLLLFFVCYELTAVCQTISIDTTREYQVIEGFGGFGAKKVWWDTSPYWDQEYVNQVIDNLGCTFIRTQIYWESELPNDNSDSDQFNWNGFKFGLSSDDNGKQFDFIKRISEKGAKLVATVWTPPIWMKGLEEFYGTYNGSSQRRRPSATDLNTQCSWCGGSSGCTQVGGRLKPEYYNEFAEYLAAYVKTVKEKTGVDVWAINIQNEPMFPNPFESCVVLPSEYALILKVVGDKFARENIPTRLFGPEHMGEWSWGMNRDYVKEILRNPDINPYLSFYAVHSYVDGVAADYGSAEGWTTLHDSITAKYNKQLWMTETSDFEKTGFDLALSMAKSLHLALRFGRISGWIYWTLAEAAIENNKLTPLGFAFKNYYKYVRPGSLQVESSSSDKDILVTAYKKGGKIIAILINNSNNTKTINLNMGGSELSAAFYMYRTSLTENCIFAGEIRNNSYFLPPLSITTITSDISNAIDPVQEDAVNIVIDRTNNQITLNNATGFTFSIIDYSGRCRFSEYIEEDSQSVNIGDFEPGLYVLRVMGKYPSVIRKLVII
jgi:glucuronoarabinoxylan endo-1,4-beta-xylanase